MTEQLMSSARQDQLMKAAEETVGLMNVGVEPNAALSKIAKDNDMNDHEVEVVAHAVNNGRQLAHIQNSPEDDREKEFPLIDPEKVRPHGDTQPATNADQNTGYRYGVQETPGEDTEAKMDAPDADEIQEDLRKSASNSYLEQGDYRLREEQPDYAGQLREGWGLSEPQQKVAEYVNPTPFAKLSHYRIGIEEANLRYLKRVDDCMGEMQKVANGMRRLDAPKWAEVEKTAAAMGAEKATLDMIFATCDIEKFGEQRADLSVKTASRIYALPKVYELAEHCVRADTLWKEAADVHTARGILQEQQSAAENALFPKEAAGSPYSNSPLGVQTNVSASLGEFAEPIEKAPEEFTGLTPDVLQHAIGGGAPEGEGGPQAPGYDFRQEMRNIDARSSIENLMQDDYISGHSTPEVIDAYNAAMSVNPDFGRAEMISYVRQHLATEGSVPLDLQIRARSKGREAKEE